MAIIIETKKTHNRGVKGRDILNIKALKKSELPKEYVQPGQSYCHLEESPFETTLTISDNGIMTFMSTGSFYDEKEFQEKIRAIYECGERLKAINDRIRKEQETWCVEETYII